MTMILLSLIFGLLIAIVIVLSIQLWLIMFCDNPIIVVAITILTPICAWLIYNHMLLGTLGS